MNEQGNPDIANAKAKAAASVPQQFKDDYVAVVKDIRKLMWSEQTHPQMDEYIQTITGPDDVPAKVAQGMKKAVAIIIQQGGIPPKIEHPFYVVAQPAAVTMACDALEYIEQKKGIQVTKDLIAATIHAVHTAIMTLLGITESMVKKGYQMAQQKQAGQSAPAGPPAAPPAGPAGALNKGVA